MAKYVSAVASSLAKRNGRTITEQAGDRMPDKAQRLLKPCGLETFVALGVVRRFAVAGWMRRLAGLGAAGACRSGRSMRPGSVSTVR